MKWSDKRERERERERERAEAEEKEGEEEGERGTEHPTISRQERGKEAETNEEKDQRRKRLYTPPQGRGVILQSDSLMCRQQGHQANFAITRDLEETNDLARGPVDYLALVVIGFSSNPSQTVKRAEGVCQDIG